MHRLLMGMALAVAALPVLAAGPQIALSAAQRQALNIEVGKAEAASGLPLDRLPATVRVPLEGSAVVTAPFAGVVVAVLAREGQAVSRGQPLVRIQSREAMTLGADLAAARGEYRVAVAQAGRDRQLHAEGIIAASRMQVAVAREQAAAAHLHELQAARATAPSAAAGTPGVYELRAPLDGRVLERAVRLGEPIATLAKAYVIARRDRVLLELHLPARHAAALRVGLPVLVDGGSAGKVVETGGAIDAASQTVLVRAEVATGQLLPGQQTTATLLLPAPAGALSLPSSALAERAGGYVVFVGDAGGFTAVPVQLLAQTAAGRSVVSGPIRAGAEVVTAGAGTLKAMAAGGD